MARKIFLDGDKNGNRPSPTAAAMIMMIPVVVFLIMKSKQSKRRSSGGQDRDDRSRRSGGREEEKAKAKEAERAERKRKEAERGKGKTDADKQKEEEKKKKQEEAKKSNEAKSAAKAAENKKKADEYKAYVANQEKKYDEEAAKHPNDPYLNQENVPDSAYRNIRDKPFDPNRRPEKGAMMKRDAQGNKIGRRKSVDFGPEGQEPVGRHAAFRTGHPGFVEHEGAWRPRGPGTWNHNAYEKARSDQRVDKSVHSGGHPEHGPLGDPKTRAYFGRKTEELKAHIGAENQGIFEKAMKAVFAERNTPQYEEALQEDWHPQFGPWPIIACAPVDFIIRTLDDKHPQIILEAVEGMKNSNDKYTASKSTKAFVSQRLEIADEIPDKTLLVHGWFFDSFRLISTSARMNLSKGPPVNADSEQVLGKIFFLLEWLEIFGVLCAKQRLLSSKGFDFTGLSMRLHCEPLDQARLEWTLQVKLFLGGGPERPEVQGKDLKGVGRKLRKSDWEDRLGAALGSWQCVWSTLFTECASIGVKDSGFQAFAYRSLIICPGYTVIGVNAAGGLQRGDTALFSAEQMQAVTEADLRKNKPVLNERDIAKGWPYAPEEMAGYMGRFFGEMQPDTLMFFRHRQYNWCKASITATSNDYNPSEVAMWLEILGPAMKKHKQHGSPRSKTGRYIHLADLTDITNLQHQINKAPLRTIDLGGAIPVEHDTAANTRTFPSLDEHVNVLQVILPYVPLIKGTDNKPAVQTDLPSTAFMVFASSFGLRQQIDARGDKFELIVAVEEGEAQQFQADLQEQVVMSMRQDLGSGGKANATTIAARNAKLAVWLAKIKTRGPGQKEPQPVKTVIDWPADILG